MSSNNLSSAAASSRRRRARGTWRRTSTHTHSRIRVLNTSILSVVSSRGSIDILSSIDANVNPGEDSIAHVIAQKDVLHEWVDGVSLLCKNAVLGVGGEFLGVGAVGRGLLDGADEVLVEEELADVGGLGAVEAGDGVVLQDGGLVGGVAEDVDVGGAAGVVTREEGLELDDTLFVAGLDSAQESGVEVRGVILVAVSAGRDTGVDTLLKD